MTPDPGLLEWHDDGHVLYLEVNRSEVSISLVTCPATGRVDAPCAHRTAGCIVEWFLETYGLECNVGSCNAAWEVPIAWALQGDGHDLDLSQVWVIPTNDALFSVWADDQRSGAQS